MYRIRTHAPHRIIYTSSRRNNAPRDISVAALFQAEKDSKNDYRDLKGSTRDDYEYQDADDYFNCMGILAAEGTYDRLEEWLDAGVHPIDMILLMAVSEADGPKVEEVLAAGANAQVKDPRDGRVPLDLCSDDAIRKILTAN
jgi:hypothetical protein